MKYSQVRKHYIFIKLKYSRKLRKSPKAFAQREIRWKNCESSITNSLESLLYGCSQLLLNLTCNDLLNRIAKH